jgi:hypothetical protein
MILPFAGLKARTEPAKTVAFIVVWFPATNSLLLVESQIGAAKQRSGGYTLGLDYIDLQRATGNGLTQTGSLIPPANQAQGTPELYGTTSTGMA